MKRILTLLVVLSSIALTAEQLIPPQTVFVQPPAPIYRYVVPRPPAYYAYPPFSYRYYGLGYETTGSRQCADA